MSQNRIIRVFPRKTSATPDDTLVRVNEFPGMFDEADEIHVSVLFTWDIPQAEKLAKQWEVVAPVKVGGPAYGDRGGEFIPGRYVKNGYVITSRGCPNSCWFCRAWKNEGREIRELEVKDGWNLLDNNILSCSKEHKEKVFRMLSRQKRRPRFTGGLEAARLTEWDAEWIREIKPEYSYFAYDTPDDYDPLVAASKILKGVGLLRNHEIGCYVLIGYKADTFGDAEKRLIDTIRLGYFPQAMLYNRGEGMLQDDRAMWRRFQREWANKTIVGKKMKQYRPE